MSAEEPVITTETYFVLIKGRLLLWSGHYKSAHRCARASRELSRKFGMKCEVLSSGIPMIHFGDDYPKGSTLNISHAEPYRQVTE